jgi:hypothetical protein
MSSLVSMQEEQAYKPIECFTYNYKLWHLFVPPTDTLKFLCVSTDKTNMFLVAFVRTFISMVITKIYYDVFGMNGNAIILFVLLVFYNIFNLFVLLYITAKVQKRYKIVDEST